MDRKDANRLDFLLLCIDRLPESEYLIKNPWTAAFLAFSAVIAAIFVITLARLAAG